MEDVTSETTETTQTTDEYIIEEIEYVDYCENDAEVDGGGETVEKMKSLAVEVKPSTSKVAATKKPTASTSSTKSKGHVGPVVDASLIERLIGSEITLSEYEKEVVESVSDVEDSEDISDANEPRPSTSAAASYWSETNDGVSSSSSTPFVAKSEPSHGEMDRTTLASQNFETELNKSRKDAMRGLLQGRDELRDGRQRRRCVLPAALQGLMGEANLCYARGQTELAEKVCLEIIRQVPLAPEPYVTLAQIHESDPEKCLQFSLIAAHLNPTNSEQWIRVAQSCLEQDNIRQAINCYTKAIKFNPKNIDLRLKRIELLESLNEDKIVFRCWFSLLFIIPVEQAEFLMATAKSVSERFIKENNYAKALEAMSYAYRKVPFLFQNADLNKLFELFIGSDEFKQALDVLKERADLGVVFNESPSSDECIVRTVSIPSEMNLDFRTKCIVCLVHLKAFHLIDYIMANVFAFINVEEAGDCYLDIAEALMKEERYRDAITLLNPLVQSENYSLAAVWLRHADCHRAVEEFDEAIKSYAQVVTLAPQHFEARLTLAALLKRQGRDVEALRALEQDLQSDLIDPCVLYERCFMLKDTGNIDQYVNVALLLLSRHCIRLRNSYEMFVVTHTSKYSNKMALIRENRKARREPIEDVDGPEFVQTNQPTVEEEFMLLRDVLATALAYKKCAHMQRISITALSSRRMSNPYGREIYFLSLISTIFNRDDNFAYILIKDYVVKNLRNVRIWNLFNVVLQFTESSHRYSRFLTRLFIRSDGEVDEWPKALRANYCFSSGTYKYALNDYIRIYKQTKSPLISMLIGITYASIAQQKFTTKKQMLIAQAVSFLLNYGKLREPEAWHEIQYNLGRLYQQFGVNHIASFHYKKVLDYTNPLIERNPNYLDLKRQAAYNLHMIYRKAGNLVMARKILHEHLVI